VVLDAGNEEELAMVIPSRPRHPWILALTALACLGLPAAHADVVIFKDGFMLYGKVSRDGDTITDPSGQAFAIPKGPFYILDGARRVYFSHSHVASANSKNIYEGAELVKAEMRVSRINALPLPPLLDIRKISPFSDRWERTYEIAYYLGGKRYVTSIDQRMTALTPQFVKVDALKYNWTAFYQTSELGPEIVRTLLQQHPDFMAKGDKNDLAKRYRLYRFLMQAGWYDLAEAELEGIEKAHPKEKEKVEEARQRYKKLRAMQQLDDIERGERAGRHRWVQQQLADLPRDLLDDQLAAKARLMAEKYEGLNESLKQARRLLKELPEEVRVPEQRKFLSEVADAITPDLNLDTVDRLDTFVKLSLQAEADRAAKRTPINGPAQLLCLAVSGWVLGKDASDAKFDVSTRLWRTRQFLDEYLRTDGVDVRTRLLRSFRGDKSDVAVDELAQIVRTLPPPDADKDLKGAALERQVKNVRRKGGLIKYFVQLPEEYTHSGRTYPVVIVLAHGKESARDALDRCSVEATRHGCILVAPDWNEVGEKYRYRAEEHAAVTEVLRDLRRRFQVDSDRVCLIGFGEGANMAYDVGLSHPDLFAGVVPISGAVNHFAKPYLYNSQYLPFYIVHGSLAGEFTKQNMLQAEKMVNSNFPVIQVVYKGRGMESYDVELPAAFEWMSRKTRVSGFPTLGAYDFVTMRETDNRFYWLTADAIDPNQLNSADNWRPLIVGAKLSARIGEGNQIQIWSKGINQFTIWLGRDASGREMIDFTKPVTVRWNTNEVLRSVRATPNASTYLEDLVRRGDRQQIVLAKLDLGR
jgi:hypothetical protein